MTSTTLMTAPVTKTALPELCDALCADGATLTGPAVKSSWSWVGSGPIPQHGSKHVEPVIDRTGAEIGELRLVWRARHKRLKAAERLAVSSVARLVGELHGVSVENETPADRVFRQTPVALWEEDLTGLERWARERRDDGVTDFTDYFSTVPGAINDARRH